MGGLIGISFHAFGVITDPQDIAQYPILTRQHLQESRYDMFSEGYRSKYFYKQLRRQSSSGSSGIPVSVYWDHDDYFLSMLPLWRKRFKYYNIRPLDHYVQFLWCIDDATRYRGKIYQVDDSRNILSVYISMVTSNEDYGKLIDIINEFDPRWIYILPFVLQKLTYFYQYFGKKPPASLRYIESTGELLPLDVKQRATAFFGVPIANMYGSEEMNGIAYECPFNKMHVLSENVLVECRSEGGIFDSGEGEAIITNLNNKAMPLIRYNQGDIIVINHINVPCLCGNTSPVISLIKGRHIERIKINRDIELSPFTLMEMISLVNNQYEDLIIQYRFTYNRTKASVKCFVEVDPERVAWFSTVKSVIENAFNAKITDKVEAGISFEVFLVEITSGSTKKYKFFEISDE